jgi:hypothetical protein
MDTRRAVALFSVLVVLKTCLTRSIRQCLTRMGRRKTTTSSSEVTPIIRLVGVATCMSKKMTLGSSM